MAEISRYPQTMVLKSTGALAAALIVAAMSTTPAGALSATPYGGSEGGPEGLGSGSSGANGDPAYVTPKTTITFGPASKTRRREVAFRFRDATEQRGTDFVCKLDGQRWKGCESPRWLKKLSPGRHVFAVKGVNEAGEWDEEPARRGFRVIR